MNGEAPRSIPASKIGVAPMILFIGDYNVSSWSLRPWLVLRQAGIAFEERTIALDRPDSAAQLRELTPAGRVPVLHDGDVVVWDSLAIAEYLAERRPLLWPADPAERAHARSISAEMHAGFAALRRHMPMDWLGRRPGVGHDAPGVADDIARILAIWGEARRHFGAQGDFLYGHFTIADAMYAPVVSRFVTYGVELDEIAARYVDAVMALPSIQLWGELAAIEQGAAPPGTTPDSDETAPAPDRPPLSSLSPNEPHAPIDIAPPLPPKFLSPRSGPVIVGTPPTRPDTTEDDTGDETTASRAAPPASPTPEPPPASPPAIELEPDDETPEDSAMAEPRTTPQPVKVVSLKEVPAARESGIKPIGDGIRRRRGDKPDA